MKTAATVSLRLMYWQDIIRHWDCYEWCIRYLIDLKDALTVFDNAKRNLRKAGQLFVSLSYAERKTL